MNDELKHPIDFQGQHPLAYANYMRKRFGEVSPLMKKILAQSEELNKELERLDTDTTSLINKWKHNGK